MVTVRPATPADAPGVARVHDAALRTQGADRYSEAELDAMAPPDRDPAAIDGAILAREERYVAVAEADGSDGGQVVGVGGVHLDDGRLLGVFVHPDRVGEGIGRGLFEDIEARAKAAGLDGLTIHSALNAVGFYDANGFQRVARTDEGGIGGPLGAYDSDSVDISSVEFRKEL